MAVQKVATRANWAARNPILLSGEIGFETDTGNQKIGNGIQGWNKLHYYGSPGHWGEFSSNANQSATANTPTEVTYTNTDAAGDGVRIELGSRIIVDNPGVFVFEFNLQLSNADTQIHDAHFWLRRNNSGSDGDVPLTTTAVSVIESHGGVPGNNNLLLDHTLVLARNDYIELIWAPSDANVTLKAGAAITSPYTRPSRPSVVCNVFQVAAA
ncbi:MAG: hypothetical protein ACO38Q_05370 [Aquiluna sp.]